jgi:hypothetical protein
MDQLPKAPSQDPFSEITNLLHDFTRDLARHLLGVPDEDGLLQCIRPAHEAFRAAIRSTAPDFRPYERRYAAKRTLPKASFLSNEEEQDDVQSEDESDVYSSSALPSNASSSENKVIYIDEVNERARK